MYQATGFSRPVACNSFSYPSANSWKLSGGPTIVYQDLSKSFFNATFLITILTPKEAVTKQFQAKNNKLFYEIVLPDTLPAGAQHLQGWHFCMPAGCIKEDKGSMLISFPPTWKTISFLSPYKKGIKPQIKEFPISTALAMMRKTYAI